MLRTKMNKKIDFPQACYYICQHNMLPALSESEAISQTKDWQD